jgi:uncharacterized membrane protein YuzA (DUF378 family)
MLEISEGTLSFMVVVCAIAAINWGLSQHESNLVDKITDDADVKKYIYYAIAFCGVVVLGKKYRWF